MKRLSVQDLMHGMPAAVREIAPSRGSYKPDPKRPRHAFWVRLRGVGGGYSVLWPGNLFKQRGMVLRLGWKSQNGKTIRWAKVVRFQREREGGKPAVKRAGAVRPERKGARGRAAKGRG